jgi:hypothetical protein
VQLIICCFYFIQFIFRAGKPIFRLTGAFFHELQEIILRAQIKLHGGKKKSKNQICESVGGTRASVLQPPATSQTHTHAHFAALIKFLSARQEEPRLNKHFSRSLFLPKINNDPASESSEGKMEFPHPRFQPFIQGAVTTSDPIHGKLN